MTNLEKLEIGNISATEVQQEYDFKIRTCYEHMRNMTTGNSSTLIDLACSGQFQIFKLCFSEDIDRLGLDSSYGNELAEEKK